MTDQDTEIDQLDRSLRMLAIRLKQQERIIQELRTGVSRLEALSTLAELLRDQDELQRKRAALRIAGPAPKTRPDGPMDPGGRARAS